MERANKIICPHCDTALKSVRGVRIGRQIKCLKCAVAFTVRPEDADEAEQSAGVNLSRLGLVLVAMLLYLLGGAGLAWYCFAHNTPRGLSAQTVSANEQDSQDGSIGSKLAPLRRAPKRPAVSAAEQKEIDDAIALGVWFLKDYLHAHGSWGDAIPDGNGGNTLGIGFASLPGLALLECGVAADDDAVQKAAALVRKESLQTNRGYDTYQRALAILFLDRLGEDKDEELIQYEALCLIAGQRLDDGGWGYTCPSLDRKDRQELLSRLSQKNRTLAEWHEDALHKGAFDPGRFDNSNTQFALLALWVAGRHHVNIERSVALAEKHFRTTQLPDGPDAHKQYANADGAWPYNPEAGVTSNPWPSMTCAGLLGLAIAHGVTEDAAEKKHKPLDDPAIQRGRAMLSRDIGPARNATRTITSSGRCSASPFCTTWPRLASRTGTAGAARSCCHGSARTVP
jgi:hypothetical protein